VYLITHDFNNLLAQSFQSVKPEESARFKAAHFGAYYQFRKADYQSFHLCTNSGICVSF